MRILELKVEDLRILDGLDINPGTGINFFVGGNGEGKTTLLEAIYLAGRGRSFRHPMAGPMIRHGKEATTVFVRMVEDGSTGNVRSLGVRRSRGGLSCRLDGKDVDKRSILAAALPTQWISSQPQVLLESGPGVRRRFFDMGLFHVEQDYLSAYAAANRMLKQRNAALKSRDHRALVAWDKPFAEAAERLHDYRKPYVESVVQRLKTLLKAWEVNFSVDGRYRPGWDQDEGLVEQLRRKREQEFLHGFTQVGPQRADIEFVSQEVPADRILSRGQEKLVVFALNLAQIDELAERRQVKPILLVDDLGAELDERNRRRLLEEIAARNIQSFVTGIVPPPAINPENVAGITMFHVEHGNATVVN